MHNFKLLAIYLLFFDFYTKIYYICTMGNKTTYRYQVATQNVDFTLRATIDSLGNYVLNTAGIDAQGKGFGVDAVLMVVKVQD